MQRDGTRTARQRTENVETERTRDLRARREAARHNAAKGPARNLEEAILLVRAGLTFHDAFRARRRRRCSEPREGLFPGRAARDETGRRPAGRSRGP